MKRLPLFVLFLAVASIIPAAGQTASAPAAQRPAPPAAAPAKVAVIAFQAAVTQTNEFQRDFADLQKKYDPRRQQIKSLSDEVDTLTKQLQADDAKLTDEERVTRSRAIDEKKKQLDRETQDAQSDFQGDMQQLMNSVAGKVGAVMTDYAEKHGYTLVLDAGDQQNATVLYAWTPPTSPRPSSTPTISSRAFPRRLPKAKANPQWMRPSRNPASSH